MDVLADVLSLTRLENATLCSAGFVAPWGLRFAAADRTTFHILSRGSCWLLPTWGDAPIRLSQGDVVLVTDGSGHALADHPGTPVTDYGKMWDPDHREPNKETATLFCGAFYFEQDGPHPILSLLPPVIHLTAERAEHYPDLQAVVTLLMHEASRREPGAKTIIGRLIDVLFVYIVRTWLDKEPDHGTGWIGALVDPQIGRALALIHEKPQHRWTVEGLAEATSMSRAAFAKRFRDLVGESPMAYVRRWRMDLAAKLLRDTDHSIGQVATRVGYDSETTFNRMFRESRGVSPGRYRDRAPAPAVRMHE